MRRGSAFLIYAAIGFAAALSSGCVDTVRDGFLDGMEAAVAAAAEEFFANLFGRFSESATVE